MIVRSYNQRNTSDRSSAYAALISNISERDRAKDVEQFDDILGNFINDEQVRRKVRENPRRRKDSSSEEVDAREFVELSIPWHQITIRSIAHLAGVTSSWTSSRHVRHLR